MYTEITVTPELRALIESCARGCYQRALLAGREAWSGATLRGTAKSYGYHYAQSRAHLLDRLEQIEGIDVSTVRRAHNRRVVVITEVA